MQVTKNWSTIEEVEKERILDVCQSSLDALRNELTGEVFENGFTRKPIEFTFCEGELDAIQALLALLRGDREKLNPTIEEEQND